MPFYRVHLNSGESEMLYAHSEDHAQKIAIRNHNPNDSEKEVRRVEFLRLEEEEE